MAITLLSGPVNSGKVATLVGRFIAACAAGERSWLIVPTRGDVRRAQLELAHRGTTVLGARVGTFPELVRAIVTDDLRELPAGADALLVAVLLREPSLGMRAARYPGFARTAARVVGELRGARLGSEARWQAALASLPWAERAGWSALVDRFGERLGELGVADAAAIERRAVAAARSGAVTTSIYAYGFDDLSDPQFELVEALGARSTVVLALPWERGRYAFARRDVLVRNLQDAGADIVDHGSAQFDSPLLAALERGLFEPTAEPVERSLAASGDLRFVECCGELQQAESIARAIAGQLADGVAPGEIACLASDPAAGRALLEPVLRRSGIPHVFEIARPIATTPAGRAVLDLLDAAIDDDPARYEAFARSRCSGIPAPRIDAWSRAVRRDASPRGTLRPAREHPQHWMTGAPAGEAVRALLVSGVSTLAMSQATQLLRAALRELEPEARGDRRLLVALDESIASLLALDAGGTLADLRAVLAAIRIPPPAERAEGAVVIAPITGVRTDRFDAVVLYDLHSGGFGGGASDDDAPLVARELAHVAITRARTSLTCIRQMAGGDGRERAAHPVWLELRRLAGEAPTAIRPLDVLVPEPDSTLLVWERPLAAARLAGVGELPPRADWPAWLAHVLPEVPHPEWGRLGRDVLVPDLQQHGLRVTEVEAYASCPARWLIQRHLLRERDEPVERPLVVGSLLHKLLELVVPRLHDGLDAGERLGIVQDAIDVAIHEIGREQMQRSGGSAGPQATAAERELVLLLVERFVRIEEVAGTVHVEQGFGPGLDHPPLLVDGVPVRGRIDRIDVADDGTAMLHDYKSGRSATAAKDLVPGGVLQLLLYWHALEAEGRVRPVGALYRPLRGNRPRGLLDKGAAPVVPGQYATDRLEADRMREVLDAALDLARASVQGIREGDVPTAPIGGSCPAWCGLEGICRVRPRALTGGRADG